MLQRLFVRNSAWLIGDKLLRLGLSVFVSVWFARHFGPEGFGLWNYAIAYTAFFGAVATLGLNGIVVRELAREGADAGALMGTSLILRLAASLFLGAAATISMGWLRPDDWLPTLLVGLNAAAMVLQSAQVLEFDFHARMLSRPAVIAANVAFVVATLLRIALLASDAPIAYFGFMLVLEAALGAGLLWRAWKAHRSANIEWAWHAQTAGMLLRESWPLIFSGLAVTVYMRVDQVMLAEMVGDHEVGQYAAAMRIAEVWYFIPMAIATAAFPVMMRHRAEGQRPYERFVQSLYDGTAWLGLGVAALTTLLAPWAIEMLYGPAYRTAADILAVQIWAGIAVSMSFVHSRWLLAEGLQRYGLVYTACALALNVGLNLFLIPSMGAVGAAWATLATQTTLLPLQWIFPRARPNLRMMLRTPTAPWRAVKAIDARNP
jgi:O-antigen/teichoic acid export membrane protein